MRMRFLRARALSPSPNCHCAPAAFERFRARRLQKSEEVLFFVEGQEARAVSARKVQIVGNALCVALQKLQKIRNERFVGPFAAHLRIDFEHRALFGNDRIFVFAARFAHSHRQTRMRLPFHARICVVGARTANFESEPRAMRRTVDAEAEAAQRRTVRFEVREQLIVRREQSRQSQ